MDAIDETGVFESLCYDGYSCGAGSEMINTTMISLFYENNC